MKELLKKYKILIFISLLFCVLSDETPPNDYGCPENKIPVKQISGDGRCQLITDVLDNANFQMETNDLRGMADTYKENSK